MDTVSDGDDERCQLLAMPAAATSAFARPLPHPEQLRG
jgi:hypothetical protein